MAAAPPIIQAITRGARARGLDPQAVLAVASVEGLGGGVGDQGTSFGPFQLHQGGALPHGIQNPQAWASSPAGIGYALDRIAGVAHGQHGAQAINSIVRQFERPADPNSEVSRALNHYGAPADAVSSGGAPDTRQQFARSLLGAISPTGQLDSAGLLGAIQARRGGSSSVASAAAPATGGGHGSAINELFYDPLGGIKHGQPVGAIGGHNDHVHVALATLQAQLGAEQHARQLGLHVGEESDADFHNVHAQNSYHNTDFPGTHLREAADISGDPAKMAAFYKWVATNFGRR